jgi:hypothetical protein
VDEWVSAVELSTQQEEEEQQQEDELESSQEQQGQSQQPSRGELRLYLYGDCRGLGVTKAEAPAKSPFAL